MIVEELGLIMRPRVLAPKLMSDISHSAASLRNRESIYKYVHGGSQAHYKVPALIIDVGFMPASEDQMYPSDYIYVVSKPLLWSFWRRWGFMTVERV